MVSGEILLQTIQKLFGTLRRFELDIFDGSRDHTRGMGEWEEELLRWRNEK